MKPLVFTCLNAKYTFHAWKCPVDARIKYQFVSGPPGFTQCDPDSRFSQLFFKVTGKRFIVGLFEWPANLADISGASSFLGLEKSLITLEKLIRHCASLTESKQDTSEAPGEFGKLISADVEASITPAVEPLTAESSSSSTMTNPTLPDVLNPPSSSLPSMPAPPVLRVQNQGLPKPRTPKPPAVDRARKPRSKKARLNDPDDQAMNNSEKYQSETVIHPLVSGRADASTISTSSSRPVLTTKTTNLSSNGARPLSSPVEVKLAPPEERIVQGTPEPPSNLPPTSVSTQQQWEWSYLMAHVSQERKDERETYDERFQMPNPKKWITADHLAHIGKKWNPICSCYVIYQYLHKVLKWPLEKSLIVNTYWLNGVSFQVFIPYIFNLIKIPEKLDCDPVLKLVVWSIVTMKKRGIIRPFIFCGEKTSDRLKPWTALIERHNDEILHFTWPFRVDSENMYIFHDPDHPSAPKKIKKRSIEDNFLADLNMTKEQVYAKIPRWVYGVWEDVNVVWRQKN
jgi:hypothetical protein